MYDKSIATNLLMATNRAAQNSADVAIKAFKFTSNDKKYGIAFCIGDECKYCLPIETPEDEREATVVFEEALNFFKAIVVASSRRAIGDLYKELESVDWKELRDELHRYFYDHAHQLCEVKWLGVPTGKYPSDMVVYQEIIYEVKPDFIVETGTMVGGSALYFANLFDILGKGEIITIDVMDIPNSKFAFQHPRITFVTANSVDEIIVAGLKEKVKGTVMVVLDSDHKKDHVLKEMELYASLVTVGSYMVVEDTIVNGHPVSSSFGLGPWEAVEEFLSRHSEFVQDRSREHFLFTSNPGGYLKKVSLTKEAV